MEQSIKNQSIKADTDSRLLIGPNESVSPFQAALLGIQHVLAMDVYVVPFIIASIIGLSAQETSILIQSTFLAAGIATIIQSHFCMKLPVGQGPSFIPIGAIAGIYFANGSGIEGWASVLGASLIGALLVVLLSFTGVFTKIIRHFVPAIVGGTIIFIVGLSLMPVALNNNIFIGEGSSLNQNIILAVFSAFILVASVMIASVFPNKGRYIKITSVILALFGGSLLANFMGILDLSAVKQASWFSLMPIPFKDFHFSFNLSATVTMLIIYLVLMAETTGTWFAVSQVCDTPLSDEQLNRGVLGEGLSCVVSSLLGSTPVTGYSTNAGIISITGVASRKVLTAAGFWFILFGFSGKLSALISAIPTAVIGGVFVVVCGIIATSGLQVIKNVAIAEREMYIIALPMIMTLALTFIPQDYVGSLPQTIQYLFSSPVATASLLAIALNKLLPN
ncbi:solute carrier family 23 protein [Vagococcus lutrae]|uniref:uracil-xanthine permease family protein n=1 Tax=Vagococcus lutrae TaxID=81947 RepID=UPI0020977D2D|nr:solute carrier family 23 protein [Vagococcus lutrae]MCO7151675.1 purine/pyrimidine permease [Vagococcus lutrae]MDT2819833.1 solute carrier family 23 protein [Vagococcus lutrae]MDT2844709.1 solute carrier family 23 protein [Vagococcus lutrae]WCG04326.1 purine/pyrimidine permease [Vagococcus lutrae]